MIDSREIINVLEYISKVNRAEANGKRSLEWKIFFSIITLLLATLITKFKYPAVFPISLSFRILIWISFYLITIGAIIFLGHVRTSILRNKMIAKKAEKYLADIINKKSMSQIELFDTSNLRSTIDCIFHLNKNNMWAWLWQSIVILFVSTISTYLMGR